MRLIVNGTVFSNPGTMGGNTKILLENVRTLSTQYDVHVILPDSKVRTLYDAGLGDVNISVHTFPKFRHSEFRRPFTSVVYCFREISRILDSLKAGPADVFLSAENFHSDAATSFLLQRRFHFKWIAAAFLFVPNPIENYRRKYGFHLLIYALAWLNQKAFILYSRWCATAYLITNKDDFRQFPKHFRNGRLFPFYGGVNVDQIPEQPIHKTRDVVFCSRLCTQKGIMEFLDVWKMIHDKLPDARFSIIGNGSPEFEKALREKAVNHGIDESIDWLGYVNHEAKYEIYRSARVMVHPTIFDNNGMVAAEALCSGLPVVMYDLPPLRHVYSTGCIKVPFGDKKAFADEVIKLLTDPAYASSVAPSPEQISDLRHFWNWPNRVMRFKSWLESVIN